MDSEFLLEPGVCYLNHAGIGPWPQRARDAVCRFAEDNARRGAARYPAWLAVEQRLRERLAWLIGAAGPQDIALVKNTSEGLSFIAQGLRWQPGDNIVGIAQEFPSNRIVWESLAEHGVVWRPLDLERSTDPEADLIALCDSSTRLIAVSWVQYAHGLRLDLARLGNWCRQQGILLCIDAIQGLGAVPFDLERYPADFVVADGHKWLLGPEGLGLFYVRPELRGRLELYEFGWHMVEGAGDFERSDWRPRADARRFECGSPNLLGAQALEASLSLFAEIGMDEVWRRLQARTAHLIALIDRRGFELLTPRDPERRAGIIGFRVPGRSSAALYQGLMEKGVICALRGGALRFSPHFYSPLADLERAFQILDRLLAQGKGL